MAGGSSETLSRVMTLLPAGTRGHDDGKRRGKFRCVRREGAAWCRNLAGVAAGVPRGCGRPESLAERRRGHATKGVLEPCCERLAGGWIGNPSGARAICCRTVGRSRQRLGWTANDLISRREFYSHCPVFHTPVEIPNHPGDVSCQQLSVLGRGAVGVISRAMPDLVIPGKAPATSQAAGSGRQRGFALVRVELH